MEIEQENLDETAALDTLKPDSMPSDGLTKSDMLAQLMGSLNGMKKSNLIDFFNKSMSQFGPNADLGVPPGAASINMASVKTKGNPIKEDIDDMFNGTELSADLKDRISTLVESAVNARLHVSIAQLQEEQESAFNQLVEEYKEELTENIDEYLTYSIDEWVTNNSVAIESNIKTELQESFLSGLHKLFSEHYVEIPEDKYDLVGNMEKEIEELKNAINDIQNKNIELATTNEELECRIIFNELTADLTESDTLKFEALIEDISFNDIEQFKSKLETIKEAHFTKSDDTIREQEEVIGIQNLNEETEDTPVAADPVMRRYMEYLTNQSKI